jgi:hypothetical protein
LVSPGQNVVEGAVEFDPAFPCHGEGVTESR